jgi:hypothetical protein
LHDLFLANMLHANPTDAMRRSPAASNPTLDLGPSSGPALISCNESLVPFCDAVPADAIDLPRSQGAGNLISASGSRLLHHNQATVGPCGSLNQNNFSLHGADSVMADSDYPGYD